MGIARLFSRAVLGLQSPPVIVEVHAANGLPGLTIVGLPEASVKESRERVRSAIQNSGFEMPSKRITVNLAPADLPKSGGRYDLAIALGILIATEQLPITDTDGFEFFSELSLSGDCRACYGILPSLIAAEEAGRTAVVARENVDEVTLFQQLVSVREIPSNSAILADDLRQACQTLIEPTNTTVSEYEVASFDLQEPELCLSDIHGQVQAKRALELCASGGHSLLMMGEPGAGKTMLASRLPGILPLMSSEQALETASIHSIAGRKLDLQTFFQRPFYQPHHTASTASVIGGGTIPRPGAISLAHNGVLFLDELPEFSRQVLEALREPLENKKVEVSRVHQQVSFPADFQLVAALNPTPSGYFPDDPKGRCKDTPNEIARYLKKISGPLMDRIDCHIEVPAVEVHALQNPDKTSLETSLVVRKRVESCRQRQLQRQDCLNAQLSPKQLQAIRLDQASEKLMQHAMQALGISARSYFRIIKLALTLADMECRDLSAQHLAEALSYRFSQHLVDLF